MGMVIVLFMVGEMVRYEIGVSCWDWRLIGGRGSSGEGLRGIGVGLRFSEDIMAPTEVGDGILEVI
jgi:hypothetical protein